MLQAAMQRALSRRSRSLIAALMLAAFVIRAFVPEGFMPSQTLPLSVEICPEGFPAELLHGSHHHHEHGSRHTHFEHCVFGCAGSSGPAPQPAPVVYTELASIAPLPCPPCAPPSVQLVHLPQARGPPPSV
jgi:hypothetical protein